MTGINAIAIRSMTTLPTPSTTPIATQPPRHPSFIPYARIDTVSRARPPSTWSPSIRAARRASSFVIPFVKRRQARLRPARPWRQPSDRLAPQHPFPIPLPCHPLTSRVAGDRQPQRGHHGGTLPQRARQTPHERLQHRREPRRSFRPGVHGIADVLLMHPAFGVLAGHVEPDRSGLRPAQSTDIPSASRSRMAKYTWVCSPVSGSSSISRRGLMRRVLVTQTAFWRSIAATSPGSVVISRPAAKAGLT